MKCWMVKGRNQNQVVGCVEQASPLSQRDHVGCALIVLGKLGPGAQGYGRVQYKHHLYNHYFTHCLISGIQCYTFWPVLL